MVVKAAEKAAENRKSSQQSVKYFRAKQKESKLHFPDFRAYVNGYGNTLFGSVQLDFHRQRFYLPVTILDVKGNQVRPGNTELKRGAGTQ